MKLQIDTKLKEIIVEESVNLEELFNMIKQLFPDGEWKEYKLRSQFITNWSYPIIIKEWANPYYPWQPNIIYGNGTNTGDPTPKPTYIISSSGTQTIFNVEY